MAACQQTLVSGVSIPSAGVFIILVALPVIHGKLATAIFLQSFLNHCTPSALTFLIIFITRLLQNISLNIKNYKS
jgi:hypothetical protein